MQLAINNESDVWTHSSSMKPEDSRPGNLTPKMAQRIASVLGLEAFWSPSNEWYALDDEGEIEFALSHEMAMEMHGFTLEHKPPSTSKFWIDGLSLPNDIRTPEDILEQAGQEWLDKSNGKLSLQWETEAGRRTTTVQAVTVDGDLTKDLFTFSLPHGTDSYPCHIDKDVANTPAEFEKYLGRHLTSDETRSAIINLLIAAQS